MKKPLIVLSLSVLSLIPLANCGSSNQFITLTINPTIGYFNLGGDTDLVEKPENFVVEKGSLLKDLAVVPPVFPVAGNPEVNIPCLAYSDGTNILGANYQFDNDITIYANYFSSINEAHSVAMGIVSYTASEACGKQPDYIAKISEKTLLINNYIKQTTLEYGSIGMGKLGKEEVNAFARQPEAIDNIYELSEFYYKAALECNSDLRAYAIGRIGSAAVDAAARQPDAIKICLTNGTKTVIERTKEANAVNSFAYSLIGIGAMDAIARQPAAYKDLIDGMDSILKKLTLADNSGKALAIGNAGKQCMDACARQPSSAKAIVEAVLKNIDDILNPSLN